MKPKFEVGDVVWRAKAGQVEKWITCPDCCGTRILRVILGDGSEVTIECAGCALGYEGPRGVIKTYDYAGEVILDTITGIRVDRNEVEYTFSCWLHKESDVFATREEAEARAAKLQEEYEQAERKRIAQKHKDTCTWAWNVSYHRQQIRMAEKQIAYHTAKLNAAKVGKKTEVTG